MRWTLLAAALLACNAGAPLARVSTTAIGGWPRMRADRFGCFLERQLGARDPRFNCALQGYENKGDPCKETGAYYEGPAFPDAALGRLTLAPKRVSLSWEHGELQAVTVALPGHLSEAQARRAVGLPSPDAGLPENISLASVDTCGDDTCVQLQGFDHMGAGEVDCPE